MARWIHYKHFVSKGLIWNANLWTFVLFCSVTQLCPVLWNPMDCSTPGSSILNCLLEFAQVHVHWVSDGTQPSHPLSPLSPALDLSQHHGLFQELALHISWPKYWSFSISPSNEYSGLISFRIDWFDLLAIQGLSRVFSNTTILKHQFFGTQPLLWSNSHICTWLLEKP